MVGCCVTLVCARSIVLALLAVLYRLVTICATITLLKLVQMMLKSLLVLQVVLEEDVFLGLGLNECILHWATTCSQVLRCLLRVDEVVVSSLRCSNWRFCAQVALVSVLRNLSRDLLPSKLIFRHHVAHAIRIGQLLALSQKIRSQANSDVAETQTKHLYVVVVAG